MTKPWQAYARHVLACIDRISLIRERGDITRDSVLHDAVLRNLQTLCESTQRLPENLKDQYPEIPWHQIAGLRNILVHNYLGEIDPIAIAGVVERHLDPLRSAVQEMLQE